MMILLIAGTRESVIVHGRRDFADVIKLRVLKWSDCPGLPEGGPSVITRVLKKGKREAGKLKKEM